MSQPTLSGRLKKVPNKPGVYLFKDSHDKVIYIGKAKQLKKRMSSYFQKSHADNPKTQLLVELIRSFDFVVTDNEFEALILENNLIKRYQPAFNTDLRDDKTYPYIAITNDDDFPRVYVTRELHRKGTLYFGPYTRVYPLRKTLDLLRSIFPIRTYASKRPSRPSSRSYLDYHIKWGLSGKMDQLDKDEYRKVIDQVIAFLEGRDQSIVDALKKEMNQASENLEFEKASRLRDRIEAATSIQRRQRVVSTKPHNQDVIGLITGENYVYARILFIRQGKLIGSRGYVLDSQQIENDALTSFVEAFYNQSDSIPSEVLLPADVTDQQMIETWLSNRRGKKVSLKVPVRGEKRRLVQMAIANAKYAYEVYRIHESETSRKEALVLSKLQKQLSLPLFPYRIECFDISTLQGSDTVGSMVVFENGLPKRSDYRKFKVKMVEGLDDYASMVEVIKRRLRYLADLMPEAQFSTRPDLIVVDGGKPQLSAALKAINELGLKDIPIVALAKREEELFLPGQSDPLILQKRSSALNLIRHLRDEAHRFAIQFHRDLRGKKMLLSTFDSIPGVGKKRKRILIKYFGSPEGIFKATLGQLQACPGVPQNVATEVFEYLHSN